MGEMGQLPRQGKRSSGTNSALQAKLEDNRIELDTCKQEKDIMEEDKKYIN